MQTAAPTMTDGQPFFCRLDGSRKARNMAFGKEGRNGVMEKTKKLGDAVNIYRRNIARHLDQNPI
jgi:hypothetical protein